VVALVYSFVFITVKEKKMSNSTIKSDPLIEMIQQRESERNKHNLEEFLKDRNLIVTTNPISAIDSVQMLSTDDVCKVLKVDRHVVYAIANNGELRGFKKKGWKFRLEDVRKYIDTMIVSNSSKGNV